MVKIYYKTTRYSQKQIHYFWMKIDYSHLDMLEEQEECVEFEPGMFVALVDKVIIHQDGWKEFCFRNGMKCEYSQ